MGVRLNFARALAIVLLLGAGSLRSGAEQTAPTTDAPGEAVRLLAGRSVAEWQEWFKEIDFSTPQLAREVPALLELMNDPEAPPLTRQQAAHTLGRIGSGAVEAVPALVNLLPKNEPFTDGGSPRQWALKALALMGKSARDASPAIIEVLDDPHSTHLDRLLALEALGRIGAAHPENLRAIVDVLERPKQRTAETGPQIDELETAAVEVLSLFGPSALQSVPVLMERTRSQYEPMRRAALTTLGSTANPLVLDALVDAMQLDESPAVRDTAAVALSQLNAAAVPVLAAMLEDGDAETRSRAAGALRLIGKPAEQAVEGLTARLSDPEAAVRMAASEALWAITGQTQGSLDVLLQMLTASQRDLRMRAHRLIVEIGRTEQPPELLERLRDLAESRDPRVRQAAFLTLRELAQQQP